MLSKKIMREFMAADSEIRVAMICICLPPSDPAMLSKCVEM